MPIPEPEQRLSFDQFLALERASEDRGEYHDGVRYVLQGSTETHNTIALNIVASLHGQLRQSPCQAYALDLSVFAARANRTMYPDVYAVCGEKQFHDGRHDILLNPVLIVEVLSPSTELSDRTDKFEAYQTIQSLQEYVLVSQSVRRFERYTRQSFPRWLYHPFEPSLPVLRFESISCEITIADLYERTAVPNA